MYDINIVKKNLIDMLEGLDDQLSWVAGEGKQFDNQADKNGEQLLIDNENSASFKKAVGIEMEKIQQVLYRMDADTYVSCLSCGKAIKKKSVKETGVTGLCIKCSA